jgi:hypothetical protein
MSERHESVREGWLRVCLSEKFVLPSATLLAIALPFFVVTYVPSSDLPQHLAQIRLFLEMISGRHAGVLTIQWFSPNTLVYSLVGLMWVIFPPVLSGKMTMLALALLWSGAVFVLAGACGRPRESAVLASLLTLSGSFYWGFINFLSGWPIFVLWLLLARRREGDRPPLGTLLLMTVCSCALLFSHVLWLAAGLAALALLDTIRRSPVRLLARHCMAVAPVVLFTVLWYPRFHSSRLQIGFDTDAHWQTLPWERLTPDWVIQGVLAGLTGPWDAIIIAAVLLWGALALFTNRGSLRSSWDRELGGIGLLMLAVSLAAPDKYLNTISFASRWFPVAVVLLLLSLPGPKLHRAVVFAFPLTMIAACAIVTSSDWRHFERDELSGLNESLRAIPDSSSTLGLDFIKLSAYIRGRPFLQTFAYSQVLHGGELNFSFVLHGTGIVALSAPPVFRWTPNLEWYPEDVDVRDFRQFDVALVNGTDEMHESFRKRGVAVPMTFSGRWRAYKCVHPVLPMETR